MPIDLSREGRVLRLTLNRPDKRNALNLEMCREIVSALRDANNDQTLGAILLAGSGKAFCAGMDLTEAADVDREELAAIHDQLFSFNSWMLRPVVAGVQGAALAGGTGLVANAHIAIAEAGATFGLTEVRIGLWPVLIFPAVIRAVGERRAVELALTGRTFGAPDAERWGLVSETVASGELPARAAEVAHSLADSSLSAIQSGLEYTREIRGKNDEEVRRIGRLIREQIMQHVDFAEGIRAFGEKRAPEWSHTRATR
jgi:enoyl-CoA hydratase/carnithine racemase